MDQVTLTVPQSLPTLSSSKSLRTRLKKRLRNCAIKVRVQLRMRARQC